jgi:hypothetical protein
MMKKQNGQGMTEAIIIVALIAIAAIGVVTGLRRQHPQRSSAPVNARYASSTRLRQVGRPVQPLQHHRLRLQVIAQGAARAGWVKKTACSDRSEPRRF